MNYKNTTHICGVLYEHDLKAKVSGDNSKNPGTPFITGTISVATDDAMTNIVSVHFSYVTPTFGASGKPNDTYTLLKNVVDGVYGTYMKDGAEKAIKVRIDSAIALNEFYTDRNGQEELVSAKRNEGGFVHKIDVIDEPEKDRNTFKVDMVITNARRVDADAEKNLPEKCIVKGAIFNFRKELLPVEFTVLNPAAMNYFEGLGASQKTPVFTNVWGRQVSMTTVRQVVTESAFGEDEVREVKNTRRDFVITGAAKETYDWDCEETMTVSFLNEAIKAREISLAALKKSQDEYKAKRAATPAPAVTAASNSGFNF